MEGYRVDESCTAQHSCWLLHGTGKLQTVSRASARHRPSGVSPLIPSDMSGVRGLGGTSGMGIADRTLEPHYRSEREHAACSALRETSIRGGVSGISGGGVPTGPSNSRACLHCQGGKMRSGVVRAARGV